MARPATATTAARLATVFQASGCDFSWSILTARFGLPAAAGLSLLVTNQASALGNLRESAYTPVWAVSRPDSTAAANAA